MSEDLRTFGHVQRSYLGIAFEQMDQNLAAANKLDDIDGLYIGQLLKQGAADKAGLQVNDILLKINDKSVNTDAELLEILGQHRPGETVTLTFSRKGKILNANAVLQNSEGGTQKRDVKSW